MMGSRCWLSEMYYFNITHTVIVMIFICDDTFNILTHDSSGIKNQEGRRYFRHRHFRLNYETVFEEQLRYSSGQGGSMVDHKCRTDIDSPKTANIATRW